MSGVSNRECCAPRYKHNDSVQQHKSLDITAAAQNLYAKIADNEFPYQLFEQILHNCKSLQFKYITFVPLQNK